MSNHEKRIRAIEERLNAKRPTDGGAFRILIVEGCLPGPIGWSYAGTLRWQREAGEELEAFIERTAEAAIKAGELSLIVGGLPRGDELAEFADFETWWATIAPHYSDVPPEEKAGYARRSQS